MYDCAGPASLTGTVQTGSSSGAVSEVVTLSALQTVSVNGSAVQATIPLVQQSVATANVTSISGSCQTGFDCVDFTLAVPGVNASVGTFSGSGTQYTQGNGAVTYQVDGQPVNHADGTPVCGQSDAVSSSVIVTTRSFPLIFSPICISQLLVLRSRTGACLRRGGTEVCDASMVSLTSADKSGHANGASDREGGLIYQRRLKLSPP